MKKSMITTCLCLALASGGVKAAGLFQVVVTGNTISWGADTYGYMQVQNAQTYESLCEFDIQAPQGNNVAGTLCTLTPGVYNVTNHTFGQRIENIVIGDIDGSYTPPDPEMTSSGVVRNDPYLAINADSVFDPTQFVPEPANLNAAVYSATAAEIFWDRAAQPLLQYDIFLKGEFVGTTDGTSYFFDKLTPRNTWDVTVIARDPDDNRSAPASVSFVTGDDGSANPPASPLSTPTGLRAAVYAPNTLELFWDRQGPLQKFEVENGRGEVLTVTEGLSYFATGLRFAEEYIFFVFAVDSDGNRSMPARIAVRTVGTSITSDNAEDILAEVVRITNRVPLENANALMEPAYNAVLDTSLNFLQEGISRPDNDLILISETAPMDVVGNFGGQYACNAGGEATGVSIFVNGEVQRNSINLSSCRLPGGEFSGNIFKNNAVDNGDGTFADESLYTDIRLAPDSSDIVYQYQASFSDSAFLGVNSSQTSIALSDSYVETDTNGDNAGLKVTDFNSIISSSVVNPDFNGDLAGTNQQPRRSASAKVSYDVEFETTGFDTDKFPAGLYRVIVDLKYTGNIEDTDPVDIWNSGEIKVTSVADGSQLVAYPIDIDSDSVFDSIVIAVRNFELIRPLSDDYIVSCRRAEMEACNVQSAD